MMGASLLMMTFFFGINANAETCTQVPTCEELGFTETNCGSKKALKCQFDQTKLFCGGDQCKVGDIYYSDDTCSENYNADKTVVGVVAISGVVAGAGVIVNIDQPSSTYTWAGAVDACKSVTRGGKTAHLPTRGEGRIISVNFYAINVGLSKISGAVQLTNDGCWTSEKKSASKAYCFYPKSDTIATASPYNLNYIRCVFNF